ncbi:MAG: tetratricopeptide repeat protein [Bacteroidia bacterium]|nr:tetratricopeptide repeat protein [Bacteroidia bacterium]
MKKILFCLVLILSATLTAQLKFEDHIKNGRTKLDAKNFAGAYQDFQSAYNAKQAEINNYLNKRKAFDKLTEFEKASLENAEALQPRNDFAQVYYYRGLASLGLGKKEDALKDFEMSIYMDDKFAGPYLERGKILFEKGQKDQGCLDLRAAADLGSPAAKELYEDNFCWNNAVNYVKEGTSKLALKQYESALNDFHLAVKLNPDSASYYMYRGQCYYGMGKFNEAMLDFTRAIDRNPNKAEYFYHRGLAYYSQEKHKLAFEDFGKAVSMNPNYVDAILYRAYSCEGMGNWKSAIYDYGQVIRIKPDDGYAYYRRGLAKQESKDKTACTDFKKAVSLGNEESVDYAAGCK